MLIKHEKNQRQLKHIFKSLFSGKSTNETRALPDEITHFFQQSHPKQYCLQEVLKPLLELFYYDLKEKENREKGFSTMTYQLIKLNQLLTQEGQWEIQPSRNRVLTIIVVCRTMINFLQECQPEDSVFYDKNRKMNSLLRRLSPRLFLLVGTDYWRLYELYAVIYEDIQSLTLNQDCIAILHNLFSTGKPTNKIPPTVPSYNASDIAKNFQRWLASKIAHHRTTYRLNESDCCFAQPLVYKNAVFVTEQLFQRYQSIKQVDVALLKPALIDAYISDGKSYIVDGTPPHNVTRIQGIPVENTLSAVATIMEKSHED